MTEIASIMASVLSATRPRAITRGRLAGQLSKARATSDTETIETARSRVAELLSTFPLYPDLDLDYLKKVVRVTNSGTKA